MGFSRVANSERVESRRGRGEKAHVTSFKLSVLVTEVRLELGKYIEVESII